MTTNIRALLAAGMIVWVTILFTIWAEGALTTVPAYPNSSSPFYTFMEPQKGFYEEEYNILVFTYGDGATTTIDMDWNVTHENIPSDLAAIYAVDMLQSVCK